MSIFIISTALLVKSAAIDSVLGTGFISISMQFFAKTITTTSEATSIKGLSSHDPQWAKQERLKD